MASFFSFLRSGPPLPAVTMLPDAMFFTREVPVTAGATAAEAASQVELAIEAIAPFPLAQLYYGWFWKPGAERAMVFAAYRRRFTSEQTAEWPSAELVMPTFAGVLGMDVQPSTTVVLHAPEGVTAVHWDDPAVPSAILFRPVAPDAREDERALQRDELLRALGGSGSVIEVAIPLVPDPVQRDGELVFRAPQVVSRLPAPIAAALDVRDKGELAARRAARRRDVMMWRVTLGAAAALVLLALGELALLGGHAWQDLRLTRLRAQQPTVDKIVSLDSQARRIQELTTQRLLPLEMVTVLVGEDLSRKPADINFTRVRAEQAAGLYTVIVNGQTSNTAQINVYESLISQLPEVERVESHIDQMRGNVTTFTLTVTFKPGAVKPVPAA
jgi:hypothetical protein